MTRWSEDEYSEYMAKRERVMPRLKYHDLAGADEPDEGPESKLQGKIVRWAKEWGKPCLSFPRTRKVQSFLPEGWPDVCLILKDRVLFLELKAKRGRMSEEQKQMRLQFMALGHEIHELRSYKRFLEIVNTVVGREKP